tara:strand:+ start:887 stop:1351 length:465 start_codon:yes stop_codon:yes gene_type:complete
MTIKIYDSKDNEITEDEVGYEGQTEHIFNGVKTYTGWPTKKEDFFKYYASLDKNPESRTDLDEVLSYYHPDSELSSTLKIMENLCNKEKSLGLMEFLWYILCHFKNLKAEQYSLSDKMWYANSKSAEYESLTTRYNENVQEQECICIHDAGRVF